MRTGRLFATYIGGPTALLDYAGVRLLTDPTFDPAGTEYATAVYTLKKLVHPAVTERELGAIDAVLLSHDHHFDNLDRAGRAFLARAPTTLTTRVGAERLGALARGLDPWQTVELATKDGSALRITATPARHGPIDGDRGPVVGFVLQRLDALDRAVYVSGDTVWYEGVAEVARRFHVTTAFLFLGAARVKAVGPAHLTFTAEEAVEAVRAFDDALVAPLHYEGWEHFTEGRTVIASAFDAAGVSKRVRWLEAGERVELPA